eukprot:TRINITY_DN4077_c0_g1_i8.p1 TRINITY_DN4077_c0_g1~~TRINITY_DN4077_c0_g1_i8.p1  ORF type:complete len:102 (+),score=21.51 TRINITY_DN4077_c0_g1_i8:178-483(+)
MIILRRICDELESLHHEVDQDREKYEEKMRLIRKYNEEMDILTRKIAAMKYVVRATVTTWTPEVEASLGLMGQTRDFSASPSPIGTVETPPPDSTFANSDW